MGSIIKRNNTWTIIYLDSTNNKRRWKAVAGTKRDAERQLREIEHSLDTGSYVAPNTITLGEHALDWLERHYNKRNITQGTYEGYKFQLEEYILPRLGHYRLTALDERQIEVYYGDVLTHGGAGGRPLSTGTVEYHRHILSVCLKDAVRLKRMPRNIAAGVSIGRRAEKKLVRSLEEWEISRLVAALDGNSCRAAIFTALHSGMRLGEISALTWQNVDLGKAEIRVEQTLRRVQGGHILKPPKTKSGIRMIPMTHQLKALLLGYRLDVEDVRRVVGISLPPDAYTFGWPDGRPLLPRELQRAFHELRHTCASLLIRQGVDTKTLTMWLGHHSVKTTLDVYGHLLDGQREAAAERLSAVFSEIPSPEQATEC